MNMQNIHQFHHETFYLIVNQRSAEIPFFLKKKKLIYRSYFYSLLCIHLFI